jgi:retron-type reverse transcriptase
MTKGKVILALDEKFFKNIFEPKRKELQQQIGVNNLSQAKFSKMIKGFIIKKPKNVFKMGMKVNRRKRRDVKFQV